MERNWYPAKYSLDFYDRTRIQSFGMWTVTLKNGRCYEQYPRYFGICDTYDQAKAELLYVLNEIGLRLEQCALDESMSINLVRALVDQRMAMFRRR